MSLPKVISFVAVLLFGAILFIAFFKGKNDGQIIANASDGPIEVKLEFQLDEPPPTQEIITHPSRNIAPIPRPNENLPNANRIQELFNTRGPKLPFVQTVTYKSRVAWLKGRPAWLSDYAAYYKTSRHFIARSLNGEPDYFQQDISNGDKFNVFNPDKDIAFHFVIDTSRCKMWFYAHDRNSDESTLLKTYDVGLGRLDSSQISGLMTPLGTFTRGEKVAIYKPKTIGFFNGEKVEMVRIFGTRWIPFESDDEDDVAHGLGLHGTPWTEINDELAPNDESIGRYESDGSIRLSNPDIEEIFSIVITKPTTFELVRDFHEAHIPGVEKAQE